MQTVRVSRKFQIAVPAAARQQLGIGRGDELLVDVRGDHLILARVPESHARHLAGLHQEVWAGVDPRTYVLAERDAWQRQED